jgi:hypothetical protein
MVARCCVNIYEIYYGGCTRLLMLGWLPRVFLTKNELLRTTVPVRWMITNAG